MRRLLVSMLLMTVAVGTVFLRVNPASAADAVPAAERLAIGRINWSGNVPQPLRRSLMDRLVAGLQAVAFQVVKPEDPGGLGAAGQTCEEAECWRRAATSAGVSYLIAVKVEEQDKTFAITLELISGRSGSVVGTNRERCEICGSEEVGEKMSLAAATLRTRLQALAEAPARFVIRSRPEGAFVKLDGKPVGQTPVDVYLKSGEHQVVIEHEGWSPLERTITATSGVDETLELDLVRPADSFPFRTAGWIAVGAGVALAGGGAYLLHKDGAEVACSEAEMDRLDNCPRVYNTKLLGASLLGLSAVSLTLGGVWLYMDSGDTPSVGQERAAGPRVLIGKSGRF